MILIVQIGDLRRIVDLNHPIEFVLVAQASRFPNMARSPS